MDMVSVMLVFQNMKNQTEVNSPCIRNCCLDPNDICLGCMRSLDEILAWGSASVEDRLLILEQTLKRRIDHDSLYIDSINRP